MNSREPPVARTLLNPQPDSHREFKVILWQDLNFWTAVGEIGVGILFGVAVGILAKRMTRFTRPPAYPGHSRICPGCGTPSLRRVRGTAAQRAFSVFTRRWPYACTRCPWPHVPVERPARKPRFTFTRSTSSSAVQPEMVEAPEALPVAAPDLAADLLLNSEPEPKPVSPPKPVRAMKPVREAKPAAEARPTAEAKPEVEAKTRGRSKTRGGATIRSRARAGTGSNTTERRRHAGQGIGLSIHRAAQQRRYHRACELLSLRVHELRHRRRPAAHEQIRGSKPGPDLDVRPAMPRPARLHPQGHGDRDRVSDRHDHERERRADPRHRTQLLGAPAPERRVEDRPQPPVAAQHRRLGSFESSTFRSPVPGSRRRRLRYAIQSKNESASAIAAPPQT